MEFLYLFFYHKIKKNLTLKRGTIAWAYPIRHRWRKLAVRSQDVCFFTVIYDYTCNTLMGRRAKESMPILWIGKQRLKQIICTRLWSLQTAEMRSDFLKLESDFSHFFLKVIIIIPKTQWAKGMPFSSPQLNCLKAKGFLSG